MSNMGGNPRDANGGDDRRRYACRADADRDDLARLLSDELRRREPARDQTHAIMSRLGYAKASARDARRHRMRRLGGRVAMALVAAVVMALSLQVYNAGTRQPEGPTIPAAVQQDLQDQQQRIDTTVKTFRNLLPIRGAQPGTTVGPNDASTGEPPRQEIDRWALGPVRWM